MADTDSVEPEVTEIAETEIAETTVETPLENKDGVDIEGAGRS